MCVVHSPVDGVCFLNPQLPLSVGIDEGLGLRYKDMCVVLVGSDPLRVPLRLSFYCFLVFH